MILFVILIGLLDVTRALDIVASKVAPGFSSTDATNCLVNAINSAKPGMVFLLYFCFYND
jgi:hypothetical protein